MNVSLKNGQLEYEQVNEAMLDRPSRREMSIPVMLGGNYNQNDEP